MKIEFNGCESIKHYLLAQVCNDIQNADKYKVVDEACFYEEEYIGTLKITYDRQGANVVFSPQEKVKYIKINCSIDINE